MSGTSRRKGRRWETTLVNWFNNNGHPNVERNEYLNAQSGDLLGIPFWSLEAKNAARLDLAGWTDQAQRQAETADCPNYAVIAKRKGTADPGDAYVIMPLRVFAAWLKEP